MDYILERLSVIGIYLKWAGIAILGLIILFVILRIIEVIKK